MANVLKLIYDHNASRRELREFFRAQSLNYGSHSLSTTQNLDNNEELLQDTALNQVDLEELLVAPDEVVEEADTAQIEESTRPQLEHTEQLRQPQDTNEELSQLEQAHRRHEEMENVHAADYDGAMTALKDQLNVLRDENASMSQELSSAKSDIDTKNHTIASLQGSLQELQQDRDTALNQVDESQRRVEELQQSLSITTQDLDNTRNELDAAKSKLQGATSPQSRAAMEQQHQTQVATLQSQIDALESKSKQELVQHQQVKEELKASQAECEELACAFEESQGNLVHDGAASVAESTRKRKAEDRVNKEQLEADLKEELDLLSKMEVKGFDMSTIHQRARRKRQREEISRMAL